MKKNVFLTGALMGLSAIPSGAAAHTGHTAAIVDGHSHLFEYGLIATAALALIFAVRRVVLARRAKADKE